MGRSCSCLRLRRRTLIGLGIGLAGGWEPRANAAGCALTEADRKRLAEWLSAVAGSALKIAKVRRVGAERGSCRLELIFMGEESKLGPFLNELHARLGWSLPQRALLKLAKGLRVPPSQVSVDIIAGETAYSTYVKPEGGLVVLEASVLKHQGAQTKISLPPGEAAAVGTTTEQDLSSVAAKVREIMVRRLKARHAAPLRIQPSAIDLGSFTLQVDGVKNEALVNEGWWEYLEIAVFVAGLGPKSFVVNCLVDGRYGAGAGSQPPTDYQDMEPKFSKELQNFVKAQLAEVQKGMQRP